MEELVFRPINLPKEFVFLLKSSIHETRDEIETIARYCDECESLKVLIPIAFKHFENNKNTEAVLRTFSWNNVRDRLASFYIHYALYKCWPGNADVDLDMDLDLIESISKMENLLSRYQLASNNRIFLLGFYFRMLEIGSNSNGNETSIFAIPKEIYNMVALIKAKVPHMDWAIILLWHLYEFFGPDLPTLLRDRSIRYEDLYVKLQKVQQEKLIRNALHYAYSIDEVDMFTKIVLVRGEQK